jgi:vacuolar protein sorting-associated protein 51
METADHGMARMQELLSSYYGMQDKESEAESQRDIDSPAFQSDVFVRELLQTKTLSELLTRDDKLIREIKELDTNMQMLVYENYNKFISATDSIRKMRSNVATMEREVDKVVKSMDVITDKSEAVNVALAPHRSHWRAPSTQAARVHLRASAAARLGRQAG